MPDPALPSTPAPVGTTPNVTRQFLDLQGRPMRGQVTLRGLDRPQLSLEIPLTSDGGLALTVPPGRYALQVMLRDKDDVRSFVSEEIKIEGEL